MSRQVRPLPFHIAHWEAQPPVDNNDILNTGTGTVVTLMNGVTVETTVTVVTVVTIRYGKVRAVGTLVTKGNEPNRPRCCHNYG